MGYLDETGIHTQMVIKYLNAYRTDFDVLDQLWKGDFVESADGVEPHISGIVQSVNKNSLVTIKQGYNVNGNMVST